MRAWVRRVSRNKFVPVRVQLDKPGAVATQRRNRRHAEPSPQHSQPSALALVVTHPASGVRIEGLSIEQLAALSRGLC